MSRIIVKNLPKTITEKKLREIFEAKGNITDLQLKYNKAGVFRQFAFVGYKTEDEAKEAKEYFNNTFVLTSKIQVETCSNLNDPNKPKAWKEFLKEKTEQQKLNDINEASPTKKKEKKKDKSTKSKLADIPDELKKDPKFKEFLAIHEDRKSKPLWADDVGLDEEGEQSEPCSDVDDNASENGESVSDMKLAEVDDCFTNDKKVSSKTPIGTIDNKTTAEQEISEKKAKVYDFVYTAKLRNLPYSCKKKQIKEFFHPLKIASLRIPRKSKGFSYVSFKTEKDLNKALNKHRSFLGGHRIDVIKYSKKDNFVNERKNQVDEKVDTELLAETGRIYARNLCYSVVESDLEQLFSKYGPLSELYLPTNRLTKKALGFAFVTYLFAEHAVKAFTELDGSIFQGRLLHLIPAQPKKEIPVDENETNYKKKKEAKLKALSGSSHNWNILFLSTNAVADVIAERFNVEKSKLLSGETAENVAVRMALAETNIVLETRNFLIENGVQLDAFSQAAGERSKTVIIVKHLPAKTSPEELNELFSQHGTVARIILPPSGLVALVEFQDPAEAKTAFKKLAYRRFHHLPLYLEWAPVDGLKDPPPKIEPTKQENDDKSPIEDEPVDNETETSEPAPQGTTVFVKNLNFDTTQEDFKKHFEKCGPVYSAEIATKKDLKTGKLLSMGFGFVQYKTKQSATRAIKDLQMSKLDGHSLEVKLSTRATLPSASTQKRKYDVTKQLSAKILVRNVPFQATDKDVRELFCQFGSLKFVRLPKKMGNDDGHRGFAFVEYLTKGDAKRAFEALCHSTHLFGRRLVLEWSNSESEDINEIRKKTAKDFIESGSKKKLRKTKFKEDVALASARSLHEEE